MANGTRITCDIDLSAPGRQSGCLRIKHSDNRYSLGFYPVDIISIKNGVGPTALLIGGVHGDEFEGPVALRTLAHELKLADISGQILILPTVNTPAVESSSRVSPVDDANMNRAFPGHPDGGPTAQLAFYIENVLLPKASLAIDLHSGGKASVFAPAVLPTRVENTELRDANMRLAGLFGAPLVWVLSGFNDNRSVNSAAERAGTPMVAAELGGGGGCDPQLVALAMSGVLNCLRGEGILSGEPEASNTQRLVEIQSNDQNLFSPIRGLFHRFVTAGQSIRQGDVVGHVLSWDEPDRAPIVIKSKADGVVLAHGNRGIVERGDLLAMIAVDITNTTS